MEDSHLDAAYEERGSLRYDARYDWDEPDCDELGYEVEYCPLCDGELRELGQLGPIRYQLCRDCGAQFGSGTL